MSDGRCSASSVEILYPALIAPVIAVMLRTQAALPPAEGRPRGIPCNALHSLAHVRTLASLHPESLCGFNLVIISFLGSAYFFHGTIFLVTLRQGPIAFVAYDAMAVLIPRVQVAHAARALQARSLGPDDAEATLHHCISRRVRGAPTLAWSLASSTAPGTVCGQRNHRLLVSLLPG